MSPTREAIIIDYENKSYKRHTQEFINGIPKHTKRYLINLFPFATWIHRYNLSWLIRDLIAGATVGVVVVPQSMGYAKIAALPPEYGLYTAFVGLCVYCLFATSKDISIGPTAVMSLLVGQTIVKVVAIHPEITGPQIAVTFSIFCGIITLLLGLVRLGILVDFIPAPAIAGFMSGSAITITVGQLPKLFGITSINTQDPTYLIFGNFFKHLPNTKLDVAFGLVSILWLYGIRYACQVLGNRYPKYNSHFYFFGIMRNGILVIFGTLIAFLINIGKTTSPISILKTVPPGFQAMGVPDVKISVLSQIASSLPSGVIILILEHVAIAKSFGRINDYTISPDQEIIAIGFTNIWAAFFGAYPSTGSFSRTAIVARSGVKTPIAGIFAALIVLLALYALTPAFYYIPDAVLAAIVIHAVAGLVSGVGYMKRLAAVSIWELGIFVITVIITFFTTVEYGIYASVGMSIVILLFRIARPRFWGMGRIPLHSTPIPLTNSDIHRSDSPGSDLQNYLYVSESHPTLGKRVESLPSGLLMCRVDESLTYPNSSFIADKIITYCKIRTRSNGKVLEKGDRAWNDDSTPASVAARENLPRLHALILDFASVNHLDSSGLQAIVDAQNTLNRYSGHHVEFHFVNIVHPGIRRCLIVANFGTQPRAGYDTEAKEILPVVPASKDGPQQHQDYNEYVENFSPTGSIDGIPMDGAIHLPKDRYPFFHWSADEAVRASIETLHLRKLLEQSE
ncbi:sulfate permease [Backusella circina FSU 941]|nr:sulfate permease [Backusella circina FSU 941]